MVELEEETDPLEVKLHVSFACIFIWSRLPDKAFVVGD
jgi:hypothetical protein